MPSADPIFQAFIACQDRAQVNTWLEHEIDYYLEHDPAPYRVKPLTREDGRRAVVGHLALNAGYYGKDVVDKVHEFFGGEGFLMPQAGRTYAMGGVATGGTLNPPALKWYERLRNWLWVRIGI